MTVLKKHPGTCGSTALPNVAYKPSWSEKVAPTTPGLHNGAPEASGDAEAAEDVNDLRPLRGALSRVIDILLASAQSQLRGASAPLFRKKGGLREMNQPSTKMLFPIDRSHPLRK